MRVQLSSQSSLTTGCTEAPLKCKISYVSLLVRDAAVVRRQTLHRRATARKRLLLRAATRALGKAKAKVKSAPKRMPKKKTKFSAPVPHGYERWPMLLPHDMLNGLVQAGCVDRLWLGCNFC